MSDAAMIVAGAIACLGLAGAGSAFGTGFASAAAVGAWKKCYAKINDAGAAAVGAGVPCLVAGIFAGLAIGLSALFQGRAGAAACDAQAETNQGFTNYLAALGIVETVAIFAMVFALIALGYVAEVPVPAPAAV